MSLNLVDLVKINITSTGTATLQLGSAVPSFRGVEALIDGLEYGYSIQQGAAYEVGRGIYDEGTGTLTRGVLLSSDGGVAISLVGGGVVTFTALADDFAAVGPAGPAGPTGGTGPQGPPGSTGPAGPPDPAAVLAATRITNGAIDFNRRIDLTARLEYFVSSTDGQDVLSGASMKKTKLSITGLQSAFRSWGITSVTISPAGSGITQGSYFMDVSGGTMNAAPKVVAEVGAAGTVVGIAADGSGSRLLDPGDFRSNSALPVLTLPAGVGGVAPGIAVTLGRVLRPGEFVGLEEGSYWPEQLSFATPSVTIFGYAKGGATRLPRLDCTAPVPTWANVSGDIWTATLVRASDYIPVGGEDNWSLWLDATPADPGAGYTWLPRKATALVNGDPEGTYYIPAANIFAESNPTAPVTIRAPTGVNPNTLAYRYNKRSQGLIATAKAQNVTVEGVFAIGPLSAQGSMNAGVNLNMRRCGMSHSGKHDLVFSSGNIEDVLLYNHELETERLKVAPTGTIPITAYAPDPRGLKVALRRVMSLMPPTVQNTSWWLSHSSLANSQYDEILLEAIYSSEGGTLGGLYAKRQLLKALTMLKVRGSIALPDNNSPYYELTHSLITTGVSSSTTINSQNSGGGQPAWLDDTATLVYKHNGLYRDAAANVGSPLSLSTITRQNIDFSNNTMRNDFTSTMMQIGILTAGSPGVKRNIFIRDFSDGSFRFWVLANTGVTSANCPFDYNVYINVTAKTNYRWRVGSTSYTFAQWQALGFDTHSIEVDAAGMAGMFLSGVNAVKNGDYRLNPAYTGTFTDGTPIVGNAGIQERYDHNSRLYTPGQPAQLPVVPANWDEIHRYLMKPTAWNFLA